MRGFLDFFGVRMEGLEEALLLLFFSLVYYHYHYD